MENERKRTPSGYVWDSCSLKFDLRLMGVSWSMSLTMQWMTSIIIRITKVEKKGWIINMIMENNDGLLQAVRLKLGAPDKPCGVGCADANPKLLPNDT